ncbi:DGQHR domain-containing protein [Mycobacteroides abscessus]|uniref:DGQHR domain-containing protein n=1 Tax=Mycobacteroides abscessus TaxID=36809 RepID=A0ABD7HIA0_9MYCO|nr:DNA sulfur modification protein DndB [Mycobacteroides abscessus]RIT29556.1 DGQHR domain-containing protein [Mycobacteroides abscessus]
MAITVPALKGKMGINEFYETKMRARELIQAARVASERDTWASLSIEERLQRELNAKRVRDEIVPYLAMSEDRFFGSIIVLIEDAEIEYESASRYLVKDVPAAYRKTFEQMGALTIDGGQFIILDGQHRWAALRCVIQGKDDKDNEVTGPEVGNVPDDELVVVFLPFSSPETTRRIFNKINRNARPTGRSDNIITSEDDGNAILSRRLLSAGEPLGAQREDNTLLVNWKTTTISPRSGQWTTISAVHSTVVDMLAAAEIRFSEKDDVVRPTPEALDAAYEVVHDWWTAILQGVDAFREILNHPNDVAQIRKDHAEWGLLLKPAAHMVLVKALIRAEQRGVDREAAIKRLNRVDWALDSDTWRDVLITTGGRIMARSENYEISAEMLAYLIGADRMDAKAKSKALADVRRFRGAEWELPTPVA